MSDTVTGLFSNCWDGVLSVDEIMQVHQYHQINIIIIFIIFLSHAQPYTFTIIRNKNMCTMCIQVGNADIKLYRCNYNKYTACYCSGLQECTLQTLFHSKGFDCKCCFWSTHCTEMIVNCTCSQGENSFVKKLMVAHSFNYANKTTLTN